MTLPGDTRPDFAYFDRPGPPMESVREYLARKEAARVISFVHRVMTTPGAAEVFAAALEKALAPALVQCVLATVETLQEEGVIPRPALKRARRTKEGGK